MYTYIHHVYTHLSTYTTTMLHHTKNNKQKRNHTSHTYSMVSTLHVAGWGYVHWYIPREKDVTCHPLYFIFLFGFLNTYPVRYYRKGVHVTNHAASQNYCHNVLTLYMNIHGIKL